MSALRCRPHGVVVEIDRGRPLHVEGGEPARVGPVVVEAGVARSRPRRLSLALHDEAGKLGSVSPQPHDGSQRAVRWFDDREHPRVHRVGDRPRRVEAVDPLDRVSLSDEPQRLRHVDPLAVGARRTETVRGAVRWLTFMQFAV